MRTLIGDGWLRHQTLVILSFEFCFKSELSDDKVQPETDRSLVSVRLKHKYYALQYLKRYLRLCEKDCDTAVSAIVQKRHQIMRGEKFYI